MAIHLRGVLAGISCGYLIFSTTLRRNSLLRDCAVSVWGFRGPRGAFLSAWGGAAMLTLAPFDNWWHNAYGLDVKAPALRARRGRTGMDRAMGAMPALLGLLLCAGQAPGFGAHQTFPNRNGRGLPGDCRDTLIRQSMVEFGSRNLPPPGVTPAIAAGGSRVVEPYRRPVARSWSPDASLCDPGARDGSSVSLHPERGEGDGYRPVRRLRKSNCPPSPAEGLPATMPEPMRHRFRKRITIAVCQHFRVGDGCSGNAVVRP